MSAKAISDDQQAARGAVSGGVRVDPSTPRSNITSLVQVPRNSRIRLLQVEAQKLLFGRPWFRRPERQ